MMMLSVRLLCALLCLEMLNVTVAVPIRDQWNDFKTRYNKTFKDDEDETYRRCIWESNLNFINQHNEEAAQCKHTYLLAMNHLADLTTEEYNALLGAVAPPDHCTEGAQQPSDGQEQEKLVCSRRRDRNNRINFDSIAESELPASVDWRQHGYVTPVKDQGSCGSCYAFSATGALEGQLFHVTKNLISLSEQNLVDCSRSSIYENRGCGGGWPSSAFIYVRDNGVTDQQSYPYQQHVNTANLPCRVATNRTVVVKCQDYNEVPYHDETALMKAVAEVGPISVVLRGVGLPTFQFYGSGIFNDPGCTSTDKAALHAVLVVGYGSLPFGLRKYDYWIVKNSWRANWGLDGYMMIQRNRGNICNISSDAIYPIGVTLA